MIGSLLPCAGLPTRPAVARDYLSWSAIGCYRACPLRYYFRYLLGLPEDSVTASLVFGSAIHCAIEHHYRELLAGAPAPAASQLLEQFWSDWQSRKPEEIRFGKDENVASIGQLAERMLVAFAASEAARPHGQILAVEEELREPIVAGCPDLLGRIDLILDAGDSLVVADWKTARTRWSQEQIEDSSEQLLLYAELVRDFAPGKPVQLEFIVLTKTKEVAVDRHRLPATATARRRVKQVVETVWRAIEAECFYPAPSAMNCAGCPFRQPCRDWSGPTLSHPKTRRRYLC